ncbi:MAG: hypothetical protein MUC49_04835 [Raineya sp.]|jgi:hypothetical protein|nr:hypothetical protein [Raineya sp.]
MKKTLLMSLLTLVYFLTSCGGKKSPEEEKEMVKTKANESVGEFLVALEKQDFEKVKILVEPSSIPNLQILIGEAEQKKQENSERITIKTEIVETIIIAPDKVHCKVKCKVKDKEVIEIIPVKIDKDYRCSIYILPAQLTICRFVVFCGRYEVFFVDYHQHKKKKKKKKHHDHGKHKGHDKHDHDDHDD